MNNYEILCECLGLNKTCFFPVTRPTFETAPTLDEENTIILLILNILSENLVFPPIVLTKTPLAIKKKGLKKSRPTYPNLFWHVTGNKHYYLLGLIYGGGK